MSSERRKRILAGVAGFGLAFVGIALLWAAGIIRTAAPGGVHPPPGVDQLEGFNLADQDAQVQSLTFRRGWSDVELRVRYGGEWFVVQKFGRGQELLADAVRSTGQKYTPEQLGGSILILQSGKPLEALRWKMHLELNTPDGRYSRDCAAVLSYSDLERPTGKVDKAAPAAGERKIGLLSFSPVDPAKKPIAVELVFRPVDVTAVSAEGGPSQK